MGLWSHQIGLGPITLLTKPYRWCPTGDCTKEGADMQKAFHVRTTVLPGGKVEIVSPELEAGRTQGRQASLGAAI